MPSQVPQNVGNRVWSPAGLNAVVLEIDGADGAGTVSTIADVPDTNAGIVNLGQHFLIIHVDVKVLFDGAATFLLGNSADDDLLVLAGEVDLTAVGVTPILIASTVDWDIDSPVIATIGGAPTTGTAICLAQHCTVPLTSFLY